jgi:preprotein translocase subunit YajC
MDQAYAQTVQTGATAPAPAGKAAPPSPFGGNSIILFPLIIFALYYLMVHNPNKKEQQKKDDLLKGIQRGDRVLTRGGLYGTVADIKENILILKISENNKVEVDRAYIESVQKPS